MLRKSMVLVITLCCLVSSISNAQEVQKKEQSALMKKIAAGIYELNSIVCTGVATAGTVAAVWFHTGAPTFVDLAIEHAKRESFRRERGFSILGFSFGEHTSLEEARVFIKSWIPSATAGSAIIAVLAGIAAYQCWKKAAELSKEQEVGQQTAQFAVAPNKK